MINETTAMTDRQYYAEMGKRIRAIRKARKMTQAQLGASIGKNAYTIHAAEKYGAAYLRQPLLETIAAALNLEAWQICADDWREQCGVSLGE